MGFSTASSGEKITQGHPGGPRLAWPCQDGSGPAEAGVLTAGVWKFGWNPQRF